MLVEEDTNIKHRTCVTHMIVFGLTRHCRLHPWLALTLLAHVTILHTFIGALTRPGRSLLSLVILETQVGDH